MAAAETKAISGDGGSVSVGVDSASLAVVAEIGHWSGTIAKDLIETPKFQKDRTRISGKRDFTGSFDGSWYMGDADGQKVLEDACLAGTSVYLTLQAKSGWTYSLWALISGEAIDVPHDGAVGVSFDFSATGQVELAVASSA